MAPRCVDRGWSLRSNRPSCRQRLLLRLPLKWGVIGPSNAPALISIMMDKDITDLFPDRLVSSELGEILEGWEVGVLDDVRELPGGGTPETSVTEYWSGDVPRYTAKDAPSLSDVFVLETERTVTQAGVENSASKILPAGKTIITSRGTVGRPACLGRPMAMNQTCYGIRGAHGYPDLFTYFSIRMAVDELQTRTHGTIFDTITRGNIQAHRHHNSACPGSQRV